MQASESSRPSSMFHVEQVRAAAHLIERDVHGGGPVLALHEPPELRRAGDVGALADHLEVRVFADHERLEAAEACVAVVDHGHFAHRHVGHRFGDGADVVRRGAAAAADEVHEAALREVADLRRHVLGRLVEVAHGVRQAGVRVTEHGAIGELRELGDVGPHLVRAERTVDADGGRLRVPHRDPERLDRLAGERSAARVRDGHGDQHRDADAARFEDVLDRHQRGLRVQRVEDRLHEQRVDLAVEQSFDLLRVGCVEIVPVQGAEGRVVDVRRDGERLRGRPDRAEHEARLVRGLLAERARGLDGDARRLGVHLAAVRLEPVVGLGDRVRAERIRLDQVRAGFEVGLVDLADHVRAGEHEQLVVALHVLAVAGEALAAEVRLFEALLLDEAPHGAVEHEDALTQELLERRGRGLTR